MTNLTPLPPGTGLETSHRVEGRKHPRWECEYASVIALMVPGDGATYAITSTGRAVELGDRARLTPAPTYLPAPAGAVTPSVWVPLEGGTARFEWMPVVAVRVTHEGGAEAVEPLTLDPDGVTVEVGGKVALLGDEDYMRDVLRDATRERLAKVDADSTEGAGLRALLEALA